MVSLDGVHQCSARCKVLCGSADTHPWSIKDTQQMLFLQCLQTEEYKQPTFLIWVLVTHMCSVVEILWDVHIYCVHFLEWMWSFSKFYFFKKWHQSIKRQCKCNLKWTFIKTGINLKVNLLLNASGGETDFQWEHFHKWASQTGWVHHVGISQQFLRPYSNQHWFSWLGRDQPRGKST